MIQAQKKQDLPQDGISELGQPEGISLKPTDIQILFEEFTLQDDLDNFDLHQDSQIEIEEDNKEGTQTETEEDQEEETFKRSYRDYNGTHYQKSVKFSKILNSFNFLDKRPTKRINI